MLRLGVLGLGSVFQGPYRRLIRQLEQDGLARLVAVFDIDRDKTAAVANIYPSIATPSAMRCAIAVPAIAHTRFTDPMKPQRLVRL